MVSSSRVILTFLSVICIEFLSGEKVFITIPDGEIMGSIEITRTNTTYYSFRGIPYAKPPINELRYQAPQPIEPWNGTINATYDKSICYQVPLDDAAESEDCLHLNVFVPRVSDGHFGTNIPEAFIIKDSMSRSLTGSHQGDISDCIIDSSPNSLLPVMVYIHGGAYKQGSGSADMLGPQYFMERDVIIVSFNYRLGPFGFFSTGDSAIPGNAGLKDQNMALQWVQKNIEYFRGDPTKVTLFGASAGSASVAYHILSPKSKGLFRAAICISGSALSPFAYQRDQVYYTFKTAGIINPFVTNMSSLELLKFATNITASLIDDASYQIYHKETPDNIPEQQGLYYGPVIEHHHDGAFITQKMYEEYQNGNINNVPLIQGVTSAEALNYYTDDYLNVIAQTFDGNLSLLVPRNMHIQDEDVKNKVGIEIKNMYSPDTTFEENIPSLVKFFDDICYIKPSRKQAEFHSNVNNVYFYQFSYSGRPGGRVNESVEGFSDSVSHGEELGYLFVRDYGNYNTSDFSQFSDNDNLVHKRLITIVTNFAKTLNPTPDDSDLLENIIWPIVNGADFAYLDIGSSLKMRRYPKEDICTAWDSIYNEYGIPPYDTY